MNGQLMLLGRPPSAWWRLANQFVRYAVLGGCGALVDVAIFAALTYRLGAPSVPSNVISVLCGILTSFVLNARWTFEHRAGWHTRLVKFVVVGIAGLVGSSVLLWALVHPGGVPPLWAKLVTLPPVALGQFAANRWWTFAPGPQPVGQRTSSGEA